MSRRSKAVERAAQTADRTARRLEQTLRESLLWMLRNPDQYAQYLLDGWARNPGDAQMLDANLRNVLTGEEVRRLDFTSSNGSQIPGEDYVHMRRWAQTRVVYTVDESLGDAIGATDWSDTVIPSSVLKHLPHPNPMVLLPHPICAPVSEEPARFMRELHPSQTFTERYEAFIVTGSRNGRHCSSDDPECTGLLLHFIATIVDDRGRPVIAPMVDPAGTTRAVPATEGMHIAVALVDQTMQQRRQHARQTMSAPDFEDRALVDSLSNQLIDAGLGLLVYLVTDEADTRAVRTRDGGRKRNAERETTVVEVGYRIGPALAAVHRPHSSASTASPTGRTVRAHIRRGHLKRVAYGPGRALRRIRWIPPVAVNWRKTDTTQVHVSR